MPDQFDSFTAETAIPAWAKQAASAAASVGKADSEEPATIPYDEYLRQRQAFIEAGQRGRQRLDQLLIAGASGALVLSVTFLEKIAPNPVLRSRPYLLAGWVILLLALALSMLGFEASTRAFSEGVRGLDRQVLTGKLYDPTTNVWDRRTAGLNRASLAAFFIGMALLVLFAFLNVPFQR
jgi:hypothetical protein